MKGRYKAITPVTDFNVSQRIRVQLIEDGHTELAVESIIEPIRDLEEELGLLRRDVKLLQDANRERKNYTDSGIWKVVKGKLDEQAVGWVKWALRGVLAIMGAGLLSLAWKGLHTT